MSTNPKIEIHGTSPFKLPSGVFEVQIALSDKKPLASSIAEKNFPSLWKDNFHLNVSYGKFTHILGSDENALPQSVLDIDSVWVIVSDQFSSMNTVFDIQLPKVGAKPRAAPKPPEPEVAPTPKKPKKESAPPSGFPGLPGERGGRGSTGELGEK